MAVTLVVVPTGGATTGEREYKVSFEAECELAPGLLNEKGKIKVTTRAMGPEVVHEGEEIKITAASATITTPANWSTSMAAFGAVTAKGKSTALEVNNTGAEPATANIAEPPEYPSGIPFETPVESGKEMTLTIPSGPEAKASTYSLGSLKVTGEPGTRVKFEVSAAKGFEGSTDTHKGLQTTVSGYNRSGTAVLSNIQIGCTAPSGLILGEATVASETHSSTTTSSTTTTSPTTSSTTTTTTSPTTTATSTTRTTTSSTTSSTTTTTPTTTTTSSSTTTSPTTTTTTSSTTHSTTTATSPTTSSATTTSSTTATTATTSTSLTTGSTTTTASRTSSEPGQGTGSGAGGGGATSGQPGGTAVVRPVATVRGRTATVVLHCTGRGACEGSTSLILRTVERHAVDVHGRRDLARRARSIILGRGAFSIAAGVSETIQVRLTGRGRALVRKAGRRGLKVTASGTDLRTGGLVLKRASAKRQRKRRR